jgi:hypothetical protein
MYTDSNHRDTLGYECPLVHCCQLVICLVVLMDGLEDGYDFIYHHDYCIALIIILLIILMMLALCML